MKNTPASRWKRVLLKRARSKYFRILVRRKQEERIRVKKKEMSLEKNRLI